MSSNQRAANMHKFEEHTDEETDAKSDNKDAGIKMPSASKIKDALKDQGISSKRATKK